MPVRISAVWVLAATILGSSLVFIDSTVVSLALPVIQRELNATALQMQWVIEAYTLVLGASDAAVRRAGRPLRPQTSLRRRRGDLRNRILSLRYRTLNHGAGRRTRAAGIGGTMLAPASLAILGACFTGDARGKAIGTWSGFTAVASTAGPVLGGVIIDHLGWRWAFFINLPIAAAVIAIALIYVPESRDEGATGSLDVLGSLLITLGLGLMVYAFVTSGDTGWQAGTIATLVAGVVAIGVSFASKASYSSRFFR